MRITARAGRNTYVSLGIVGTIAYVVILAYFWIIALIALAAYVLIGASYQASKAAIDWNKNRRAL